MCSCCPFQLLIPFVEDDSSKHEDRLAAQSRPVTEERREIVEVNKVLCSVHLYGSWVCLPPGSNKMKGK